MDDRSGSVLGVQIIPAGEDGRNGQGQKGRREGRVHDGIGDPAAFPQRVLQRFPLAKMDPDQERGILYIYVGPIRALRDQAVFVECATSIPGRDAPTPVLDGAVVLVGE